MPFQRTEAVGTGSTAAASSVIQLDLVGLTVGAATNTLALDVADMPRLFFWMRHTTSAAGAGISVIPQYAVNDTNTVGAVVTPDWLDLEPSCILPFNTVVTRNYTIAAKFIRLQITLPAGGGAAETVICVYGGTQ